MKQLESLSQTNSDFAAQAEAIHRATGIDVTDQSTVWDPTREQRTPPKALWQILMAKYWYRTGTSIGDPTTQLMSPDNEEAIQQRTINLQSQGESVWKSCATWRDPTVGETNATKPKLWRDVNGSTENATPWDQFISELRTEKILRKPLILKSFPQRNAYRIINIEMKPGTIWSHPEGWAIFIEWYQTTSFREGDQIIPRSFLISSDPELCVVCGESTHEYACQFLEKNLTRLADFVQFWQTLSCPPAVLECMRENGKLLHINDISLELPFTSPIQQYVEDYAANFIYPLYQGKQPGILDQIPQLLEAPWLSPNEWEGYVHKRDKLWRFADINEGTPENSHERSILKNETTVFQQTFSAQPRFIQRC